MSDDLVKMGRDALKDVTEGPWQVSWYVCHANMEDVKYQKTRPLSRGEKRRNLKVGDELWKQATSIGPLSTDHDHWSGDHLSCSNEDALFIAASRDLVPRMTDRIEELEAKLAKVDEIMIRRIKYAERSKKSAGSTSSKRREHIRMHALSDALGEIRTTLAELKGDKE